MAKLDDVIKNINKQYGFSMIGKADVKKKSYQRVPFRTPALTWIFRGGMPRTVIELLGMPSAGKAQPMYSKVLTMDGWKSFKDIRIGDYIYGDDGEQHEVIGVYPQGKKSIYEITFTDGATCRCSDEHLWQYTTEKLIHNKSSFSYVKELKDILTDFKDNPQKQSKYIFPTNSCVKFPHRDLKIPPYILGLLLGDGGFTNSTITFTNSEQDILDSIKEYSEKNYMSCVERTGTGCKQLSIKKNEYATGKQTVLKRFLSQYGLIGKHSKDKFIPIDYLLSDETQRLQLLAGIINTDGYVTDNIRLTSVSKQLLTDVICLCRSLGMRASVGATRESVKVNPQYNITISLDQRIIPLLSDKHKQKYTFNPNMSRRNRYIKTIKYVGEEECQCIYIDSDSHLYITDDYCVTHNTTVSYSICGSAQKVLKKEWEDEIAELEALSKPTAKDKERLAYLKDRGYKKVVYLDSEFSTSEDWLIKNGVDIDDLIFIAPENQTAEQLFQIILDLIASDGVGLVVLDSIPALVSQQAMDKNMEEKTMAGISAPLSVFSSKLLPLCNKYDCMFIGINQVRDDMTGYHQVVSPGGKMWKHTCSVRMLIRKGRYYDANYKELTSHCEEAVGNYAEVEILKNKATKPDRRVTKFSITYDCGVDGVNDCFEMAVTLGIIDKAGAWFSILDDDKNIMKGENDELLKFQGKAKIMEYLKTHEDVYNNVKEKVENAVRA